MHIFWIAGLLLAIIDLPDFGTPLGRIASAVEKVAGVAPGEAGMAHEPAHENIASGRAAGPLVQPIARDEVTIELPGRPPSGKRQGLIDA